MVTVQNFEQNDRIEEDYEKNNPNNSKKSTKNVCDRGNHTMRNSRVPDFL